MDALSLWTKEEKKDNEQDLSYPLILKITYEKHNSQIISQFYIAHTHCSIDSGAMNS